jgi:beta-glucosidase-like glycosyl hydrolase
MTVERYQGHFEEVGGYTVGFETYTADADAGALLRRLPEDPFLAGELVADETLGVESEGLIVTLKHMAMNDFEKARTNTAKLDERMLHELAGHAPSFGLELGDDARYTTG